MNIKNFKGTYSICVFGDSVSHGALDFEKRGWAGRLRDFLEKKMMDEKGKYCLVYNCSVYGDTTFDVLKRAESECEARKPDMIIFACALNDTQFFPKENRFKVEPDAFGKNLQALVSIAKNYAKKIIFVGPAPVDEGRTVPLARDQNRICRNEFIEKYNNIIRSARKDFIFIDIFSEWMRMDYKSLLHDGLHPNSEGHEMIFEKVKSAIMQ